MLNTHLKTSLLTLSITTILSACGGSNTTDQTTSGVDVTSSGAITGFGSVILNGVRYKTSGASIISEDSGGVILKNPSNAQLQTVLGVGNVVTVRGSRSDKSNGIANTIIVDNELVGEISSVSAADGSFIVLGQTVSVTPDTIIDDSIIETFRNTEVADDLRFGDLPETLDQLLSIGLKVEISGYPSQNGLEATRIEDVKDTSSGGSGTHSENEVKGFVKNLNTPVAGQFEINGLTIIYDSSDLDSKDFANVALSNGQFVEVHGTASSATMLDANRIELEDDLFDDDFNEGEIEIEGVIQQVRADATGTGGVVVINGIEITVNDITLFSEGLRVEIKGTLQNDGSIKITHMKDEAEDTVRIKDMVISADASSLITRLGLTITPTERSRLEDDTVEDDDDLSIGDFLTNIINQRIEARGFPLNGNVAWTRLEIEDKDKTDCRLRGRVDNKSDSANDFSFTIEGIEINVSQTSESSFENSSGQAIGRLAFFDQLNNGDIVQATSNKDGDGCTNGMLVAREVEFEPENVVFINNENNDNGGIDNELTGPVSNITEGSFDITGETVTVNADTLIDDSIIEDARGAGVEIPNDLPFGELTESLQELLMDNISYEVKVDRMNGSVIATSIEDL